MEAEAQNRTLYAFSQKDYVIFLYQNLCDNLFGCIHFISKLEVCCEHANAGHSVG